MNMKHQFKKVTGAIVGSVALFMGAATTAFAQSSVSLTDPLQGATFTTIKDNIINFLSWVAIPIAVIMVLVGAFQMMTSAGDPEKTTQGRKTIQYAAIGFAIALLASGITSLITNILTGQ
jgi:Mn2+/Fe2+ NRAMP family transporter